MRTLEEKLIEEGQTVPPSADCLACGHRHPPFAIREDGYCGTCIVDGMRVITAENEENADPTQYGWDSELANTLRAERNQFLNIWRWTIFPDSPLTLECQGQFHMILLQVNRLTVDYASPHEALEALRNIVIPTLEYE